MGAKTGATIWHVPQAFNWAIVDKNMSDEAFRKSRFLTREEVRTSPLLGAIYGAKRVRLLRLLRHCSHGETSPGTRRTGLEQSHGNRAAAARP
ncbi:MAG: hypothetical protein L6W00_00275 [Lentisphaeria bacterium]|nr:MAG: hypothetical protein L6W00_00275 [Lentisphaeria bacterium]